MHVHPLIACGHNRHVTNITTDWHDRRKGTDHHASRSSLHPAERGGADYYYQPADEQDSFCPGCYPELDGGRWVHDRGCPVRAARP